MDLHRPVPANQIDPQSGNPCEFCRTFDPSFDARKPVDQLVVGRENNTAWGHLTEEGHVRHRLIELRRKLSAPAPRQETTAA
jgi:hypothetical protein